MNSKIIKGVLWFLSIFLLFLAIGTLPAFSGFLFLIGGVGIMPIKPIQNLWAKLPVGKWVKAACASLAFLLGISLAPAAEPAPDIASEGTPPAVVAMQSESSSVPESSEAVAEPEPGPEPISKPEPSSEPPSRTVSSVASSLVESEPAESSEPPEPPVSSAPSSVPEPEPDSTPEPEPEPEPQPEPEPEPEVSSEVSTPPASSSSAAPESSAASSKAPESSPASSRAPAASSQAPSRPAEPENNARTVYWTPGGKSYHYTDGCPTLARSTTIYSGPLAQALGEGKDDPCDKCAGG